MCGRFYVDDDMADEMEKIFAKMELERTVAKKGEIFPSEQAMILCKKPNMMTLMVKSASFGYKNPYKRDLFINAKSETITEKPTFCHDFINSRCIVPASGYFEWHQKEKYYFKNNESLLLMAGICREKEFVVLTTAADEAVQDIHDRMPILLTPDEAIRWIMELPQAEQMLKKHSHVEKWERVS